ncbi:NAD(P)-binding protein [Rhodococcus sp. WAY2]|nr:NAD(P)-binding protein [Rhodococcus sp. WAY2]
MVDEVETAIIGAGFAGLLTAARLRQAGAENMHPGDRDGK